MPTNREVALGFLRYFCQGEMDKLRSILTEDFQLKGPFSQFDSRDTYLSHLEKDPPVNSDFKVLRLFEQGDEVCLFYEYSKPQCSTVIAQLCRFRDSKIAEIILVFDGRAFA